MSQQLSSGPDPVSWDDVNLVSSIAEFDSLRQASKALGMNASTLVRHMERLETSLGTSIFDRMPHGFVLNAAGRRSRRDRARHAAAVPARAGAVGSGSAAARPGKVAVSEGLGTFWIAPKLGAFGVENPDVVINMESTMAIRSPLRNEADIAIQFRKPDNPDLVASRLCHLHIYPFATLRYLERHGMPSVEDRKTRHRIVLQESEQVTNEAVVDFLKKSRLDAEVAFITNSSIAHLYAVERGLGIGGLPTFAMAMGGRLVRWTSACSTASRCGWSTARTRGASGASRSPSTGCGRSSIRSAIRGSGRRSSIPPRSCGCCTRRSIGWSCSIRSPYGG